MQKGPHPAKPFDKHKKKKSTPPTTRASFFRFSIPPGPTYVRPMYVEQKKRIYLDRGHGCGQRCCLRDLSSGRVKVSFSLAIQVSVWRPASQGVKPLSPITYSTT